MTADQIYSNELRKTIKYQKAALYVFIVVQVVLVVAAFITGSWTATYISFVVIIIYLISVAIAQLRLRKLRAASVQELRARIAVLKEKRG